LSTPEQQARFRERKVMYIGLGTVVLIVIIVVIVLMLRR
jgi:predicted nucleic acid-binding Zn ribbon protein